MAKEVEDYLALHNAEFTDRISSPFLASQRCLENTLHEFPDEEDLKKLKEFQLSTTKQLGEKLKSNPNASDWRHLADVVMTRIIVFNARRGSEVAELQISDYQKKSKQIDRAVEETG